MNTASAPPPRGTEDYYRRIFMSAEVETLDEATHRLYHLWEDYGWRSTIDVMAEWVCAIDYILPADSRAGYRDFTGTVITEKWATDQYLTDDYLLATAVKVAAERAERDGLSPHESFATASMITERLRTNVFAWKPFIHQALRTANATHDRDRVRAVLFRGPGVREKDWPVLRDGASYLYQLAEWPMRAARQLGKPVRPPEMDWIAGDLSIPPNSIMSLAPEGELNSGC
jgi:hypothetical protein